MLRCIRTLLERLIVGDQTMTRRRGRSASPAVRWRLVAGLATLALALGIVPATGVTEPAEAATAADFNPGRIMSDAVFYASASMNADQVQAFLSSKVPTCRAGYTCLKDYRQATASIAADQYCAGYAGAASESAATIIVKAAQSCGISPKVMIVLLEKEQSLVTDDWPTAGQYAKATGNGCPDTAPCDPNTLGFQYQLYYGARAFQRYALNPGAYNFHANETKNIQYHPDPACGSQTVHIENQATANLYNYTPYVPNAAAMANLYGRGDACSSYGNRNFWRIYTDWFGSTLSGLDTKDAISLIYALYADILLRGPDPGGVETWRNYLIGHGWSTLDVANAILHSDEYYMRNIDAAYREILGREPDPVGRADWLDRMRARSASVDDIRMTFTRSQEYFNIAGGTNEAFIGVLYRSLLHREASPGEIATWSAIAQQNGRDYVIGSIWNSYESGVIRLNTQYQIFLKRDVDPAGIGSWVPLVLSYGEGSVRSVLVGSLEYLYQARARFPQP